MNQHECYIATGCFLAAMHEVMHARQPNTPVQHQSFYACSRRFARAVDAAQAEGNAFAARWPVYNTMDGRRCHDFNEGLALARQAGMIYRYSGQYEYVHVALSPRQARALLAELTAAEAAFAQRLAEIYLDLPDA